jgi:hypothetical protein
MKKINCAIIVELFLLEIIKKTLIHFAELKT